MNGKVKSGNVIWIRNGPKTWLLLWSPNMRKWYPINSFRVYPKRGSDWNLYREAMNAVYQGETVPFKGEYNRETKTLTVEASEKVLLCY